MTDPDRLESTEPESVPRRLGLVEVVPSPRHMPPGFRVGTMPMFSTRPDRTRTRTRTRSRRVRVASRAETGAAGRIRP